jgi:rhomboid protease GluP
MAADLQAPPFAVFLAGRIMGEREAQHGVFPEARVLEEAYDVVLTRADNLNVSMWCIRDSAVDPQRPSPSPAQLVEVGTACLVHSGVLNGNKEPVCIHVLEVGPLPTAERAQQLETYFTGLSPTAPVWVVPFVLDPERGEVWTPAALAGKGVDAIYQRMVKETPVAPQAEAALPTQHVKPWLTGGIIAVLAGVFVVEQVGAVGPRGDLLAVNVRTLLALGGLMRAAVDEGQWYRLFTAPLLHGDLIHIGMNCGALFLAGVVLEYLVGRAWFLALFTLGALGGALASLAINAPNIVSVGASGAVMALLAAATVASFRWPDGQARTAVQTQLFQVLIPSLVPLWSTRTSGKVDYAAHVGGALVGALAGWLICRAWPREQATAPFQPLARVLALVSLLAFGAAGVAAVPVYQASARMEKTASWLIPEDKMPAPGVESTPEQAAALVEGWPHDPRSHFFRGLALARNNDATGAIQSLRAALAERQMLEDHFQPSLQKDIRVVLAAVLRSAGDSDGAADALGTLCTDAEVGARASAMGLCTIR